MRYRLLFFILLPLLSCFLPPAAARVKVTLWSLPTRDVRTVEDRANLAVMERFLTLHPDIDLQGFQGVSAPGLRCILSHCWRWPAGWRRT